MQVFNDISAYTKEISLSNEELFKIYFEDKSNIQLRNQIALKNFNLIPYSIKKHGLYLNGINEYEELLQEGFIILLEAIDNFNLELGFKFSSYAVKCLQSISRSKLDYNKDISLDEPTVDEDGGITLLDTIVDFNVDVEKLIVEKQFLRQLEVQLEHNLNSLEINVIKYSYGIGKSAKSNVEISDLLGIKRNEIPSIKRRAIKKLNKSDFFKEYYKNHVNYYNGVSSSYFEGDRVTETKLSNPTERKALKLIEKEDYLVKKIFDTNTNY